MKLLERQTGIYLFPEQVDIEVERATGEFTVLAEDVTFDIINSVMRYMVQLQDNAIKIETTDGLKLVLKLEVEGESRL